MNSPLSSLSSLLSLPVDLPVLAAPMAGGPTTAALVTAAARAGSLGFLAAGYKTPDQLAGQIAEVRGQTGTGAGVFGVNLFVPNPVPADPAAFARYADALQAEADRYEAAPGWRRYGPAGAGRGRRRLAGQGGPAAGRPGAGGQLHVRPACCDGVPGVP